MNISSKLATDFVKRHFNSFEFDSQPKKVSTLNQYHVNEAYIMNGCARIDVFSTDTGSTSCTMVLLPEQLCGKLGLEEGLKLIDKEGMDTTTYLRGKNKYVRVTTNRLMMLEKLMIRSGKINPVNAFKPEQKEIAHSKLIELQNDLNKAYAEFSKKIYEIWAIVNK